LVSHLFTVTHIAEFPHIHVTNSTEQRLFLKSPYAFSGRNNFQSYVKYCVHRRLLVMSGEKSDQQYMYYAVIYVVGLTAVLKYL